jgi:phage protein D
MSLGAYFSSKKMAQEAIPIQRSQSDFDFLAGLAKANGWEMYIDHTLDPKGYVLRFQFLIQDYSPSLSLAWGASLNEFAPRLTTVGDVVSVSVRVWVSAIKMEFIITVGWDYDRAAFDLKVQPAIGSFAGLSDKKAKTLELAGCSFLETPKKILSELLPRLNNRVTGTGSTIGNPAIKAGRVINLDGLGQQFSGLWRITSATHTLDSSGYKTSFDVRKEVWFGSIPVPKGASGLFRVQGQTIR